MRTVGVAGSDKNSRRAVMAKILIDNRLLAEYTPASKLKMVFNIVLLNSSRFYCVGERRQLHTKRRSLQRGNAEGFGFTPSTRSVLVTLRATCKRHLATSSLD